MKLGLLPKLLIGFGSLGLLGVVIGLMGVLSVGSLASADKVLNDEAVQGLGSSTEMISNFQQIRVSVLKELLAPTPEAFQGSKDSLAKFRDAEKTSMDTYSKTFIDDTDKANFAAFQAKLAAYEAFADQINEKINNGKKAEAVADTFSTGPQGGVTISTSASDALAVLVKYNITTGARISGANASLASIAGIVMLSVTVLGLLASILLPVWFGAFLIVRPIRTTVRQLELLAQGDLTVRGTPRSLARTDEIGNLSRSADKMATDLNASLVEVATNAKQLQTSSQNMGQRMEQTSLVVVAITQGIEAVNEHVITQSASVSETSATAKQILKNLEGLNELISEQSANVTESSASIEEMIAGTASVQKSVEKMTATFGGLQAATDDGKVKIGKVESPRVCRRPDFLGGYGHGKKEQVFTGGPGAGGPACFGANEGAFVAVGGDRFGSGQDWLCGRDAQALGKAG